jgi:hypothetical protein
MSTSAKSGATPRKLNVLALAAIASLSMSAAALGNIVEGAPAAPNRAEKPVGKKAANGYLLRCWQYGKLILEEQYVMPPAGGDVKAARLKLNDQANQPLYLTETSNATCLIRPQPAERPVGE